MRGSSLTKNTILLSIGTILTKGLMFVMVPFFSKWLSTEDYGTFDLYCTYVTLLIPIIGLSTGEAVFRFSIGLVSDEEKKASITNGLIIFSFDLLIFFIFLFIIYFIFNWVYAPVFYILLLGETLNVYFQSYLRAIKKLNIYSFSSVISALFSAFSITILIKGYDMGLSGIILGHALGYMVGNIIIVIETKYWKYLSLETITFTNMKKLVLYSYPLIPNSISWWLINASDRLIIHFFLGATANGIFAIAHKIPSLCSSIFSVFGISWQQSAIEKINSNECEFYYNSVYNRLFIILISLCACILSLNPFLFNYIFDNKYFSAYLYVPILITSVVFMSISQFLGGIQISLKQPKKNGLTTMIGAFANVFIAVLLINYIGLYAVAISTCMSNIIVALFRKKMLADTFNLHLARTTKYYYIYYIYFLFTSYMTEHIALNIFNLLISFIFFIIINRSYIKMSLCRKNNP
jgi:O-antigen/teichoic acid export membrane protein